MKLLLWPAIIAAVIWLSFTATQCSRDNRSAATGGAEIAEMQRTFLQRQQP